MPEYHLVVSDPPHREIDVELAAPCLGLTAAEVRMKANYPAPEIWLVESDLGTAREKAKTLLNAGFNAALLKGSVLAGVPAPESVGALAASPTGFTVTTESSEIEMARGRPLIAVVCDAAAREKERRASRSSLVKAETHSPFVDLYVGTASGWRAARLVPADVDFSALGDLAQLTVIANFQTVLEELRDNFQGAMLDERLAAVAYRFSIVSGTGIPKLLAEIAEDLKDLRPYDLATRLAFLTTLGRRRRLSQAS